MTTIPYMPPPTIHRSEHRVYPEFSKLAACDVLELATLCKTDYASDVKTNNKIVANGKTQMRDLDNTLNSEALESNHSVSLIDSDRI